MLWNSFVIAGVVNFLKGEIASAWVKSVTSNPVQKTLRLELTVGKKQGWLLFNYDARLYHLAWRSFPQSASKEADEKPVFSQLIGAPVNDIEQVNFDRVVKVCFKKREDDKSSLDLIFEFTGRNSNAILVESATNQIAEVLRPVEKAQNRYRRLLSGEVYHPPPAVDQLNPLSITAQALHDRWQKYAELPLIEFLTRHLMGCDHWLAQEIVARANLEPALSLSQASETSFESLAKTIQALIAKITHPSQPVSVLLENSTPVAIFPFTAVAQAGQEQKSFASIIEAVASAYGTLQQSGTAQVRLAQLQKALANKLEKLEHRHTTLMEEIAGAKQAPYHKKLGDLLTIHHANIPKKAASVTLPDDFDPHGAPITIPLDPAKTPAENAKAYFKKARKGKTGLPLLEKQLTNVENQLAALKQVQEETEQLTASSPPGDEKLLAQIESELARLGLAPKPQKGQLPIRASKPAKPQFKEFITSEGFRVIVGRNNEENDKITLEVAKGDDFWFHAQQCPGAHVVLKLDGKREPGKRSLLEAAALAAHFSDARHSRKVPVIYTRAKYVRKPRKAKPGLMTVEREKSLMVPPALLPLKAE